MSGTLKVGGVNLATHTGTDGTGNPVLDTAVFPAGHIIGFAKDTYSGSAPQPVEPSSGSDTPCGDDFQITIPAGFSTEDILLVTCIIPQCYNRSVSGRALMFGFSWNTAADFSGTSTDLGPAEWLVDYHCYRAITGHDIAVIATANYFTYATNPSTSASYIRPRIRARGSTCDLFVNSANGGFLTAQIIKG